MTTVRSAGSSDDAMNGVAAPADAGFRWLRRYVHDHYLASRAELELFERSAGTQSEAWVRSELVALTAEVAEDRAALLAILDELAVARSTVQEAVVVAAERLGRLKPNGTLLRRSPLTDLVELEAMTTAVHLKQLGWVALRQAADGDPRLNPYHLDRLVQRAKDQEARLERLRVEIGRKVFSPGPGTASVP
jgi:hypothetical protein